MGLSNEDWLTFLTPDCWLFALFLAVEEKRSCGSFSGTQRKIESSLIEEERHTYTYVSLIVYIST